MGGKLTELQTEPFTTERTWTLEELPILSVSIRLPQPLPEAKDRTSRRIRRYYQAQSQAFLRYCKSWLLPQAKTAAMASLASSVPVSHVLAELDYQVVWNKNGLWSLYTQSREVIPSSSPFQRRWGDTWDLSTGYPVPLSACYPKKTPWRKLLLAEAAESIRAQECAGTACFYEDWNSLLRQHFNSRNFFLTEDGLSFFYPMYTIGPAAEGIPTFTIPYGPEGPQPPGETHFSPSDSTAAPC